MKHSMKCFSFILLFFMSRVFGQAPEIEWQNTIGGSGDETLYSTMQTEDGGYILGGFSDSGISGDKSDTSRGGQDYWIIKLNSLGDIIWEKTIGGNAWEHLNSIKQTYDGGYILGGTTESGITGDKTDGLIALDDCWVIKLDSVGNIEWQNDIGGNGYDWIWSIQQTTDQGYIFCGNSDSGISGDKSEPSYGLSDVWVVKLDSIGNIIWQKTLGGDQNDLGHTIIQISDGGYLVGGSSQSEVSGNKTAIGYGQADQWIIKLDSEGNIIWQNSYGGSDWDELWSIIETDDGNFCLFGHSYSEISGNKTESSFGQADYWVLKIDSSGIIQWQNNIGGTLTDGGYSISQTSDGGYFIIGQSMSEISGDKTESQFGFADDWILRLDPVGNIIWQKELGGILNDAGFVGQQTSDNGYFIAGYSLSGISGNKTEPSNGLQDIWVIKLYPDCIPIQELCNGIDDDCDGIIDNGIDYFVFYTDSDGDEFGDLDNDTTACEAPPGYVSDSTDCNDTNFLFNPDAIEVCNAYDDNCNGEVDESLTTQILYIDQDGDNYGNALIDTITCFLAIAGYVSDSTDCDDSNPLIYPGAIEIFDDIDNNCNKVIDEGFAIENTLLSEIKIYPNPANDILQIDYSGNETGMIEILNIAGENIYSDKLTAHLTINIQNLPAGIYLLKIISADNQGVFNFVKE